MKYVVTGAAGFIGSHLSEALLESGHEVAGIDCFTPYYSPAVKERNVAVALKYPAFRLHRLDLRTDRVDDLLRDVDTVFHLAATPGLVQSWTDFDSYLTCNTQATQRLLEAVVRSGKKLRRFLYVSTSSVYGKYALGDETTPTKPTSPYGVTKLAGEHLCRAYAESANLPFVVLRYFSVYGPRQRPDMGYHRFIDAMLRNRTITVFGDGQQVRGNTYVADCVRATIAAAAAAPGETFNVGGGETATVWEILGHLEAISGRKPRVEQQPARPGDQRYTFADTARLQAQLGWQPTTKLREGLARQWEWQEKELALG